MNYNNCVELITVPKVAVTLTTLNYYEILPKFWCKILDTFYFRKQCCNSVLDVLFILKGLHEVISNQFYWQMTNEH